MNGFHTGHQQTDGFAQFVEKLPELEAFSVLFPMNGWIGDVNTYWDRECYAGSTKRRQIVARELSLEGCLSESFGASIPYMFNLSQVTKLSFSMYRYRPLQYLSSSS